MPKKQKKPDIMDLVILAGPEAVRSVDELGWSFLAAHGYDVAGWNDEDENVAKAAQERVAAALSERGESLCYHGAVDDSSPRFIFWYTLRRGRHEVARSTVLQFRQAPEGEGATT
ncbi:MAG: hypothetical protein IJC99_04160 [Clostridia bacterium]|nr:hypothetical protein [Clostridia bacterium]